VCIYRLATEITVDSRTLSKVLQICQKTNSNLEKIAKSHDRLEEMIKEQNKKIDTILRKIEERDDNEVVASKDKAKDKAKKNKVNFYQVNICFNIIPFVYAIFILIINFIHMHVS